MDMLNSLSSSSSSSSSRSHPGTWNTLNKQWEVVLRKILNGSLMIVGNYADLPRTFSIIIVLYITADDYGI